MIVFRLHSLCQFAKMYGMRRRLLFAVLLLAIGLVSSHRVYAACQVGEGKSVKTSVSFTGSPGGSSISVGGTTMSRNAAQCTSPAASGSYTVSCDTKTEALAADSVFAPLCGSAVELGKANSSCWTCGDGSMRCSGLDFALGQTDEALLKNRQAIDGGDASRVWRVTGAPGTFTYNGIQYSHNGDLILCGSNVAGCGAGNTTCTSALYPGVTSQNATSDVVEVVGDTVHEEIRVPQVFSGFIQALSLLPLFQQKVANLILEIWPNQDTLQSPLLSWFSNQVFQANFYPLNPKILQDQTSHMVRLQPYSTTARLCITDPDSGKLTTFVSQERYESQTTVPYLHKIFEGSRGLASKMTKHREPDQNYDDIPTTKIKTDEPLPCNTTDTGQSLITEPVATFNKNIFGSSGGTDPLKVLLFFWVRTASKISELSNLFRWEVLLPPRTVYVLKTHLLRDAEPYCRTASCTASDLTRVTYLTDSEKQQLADEGGIVQTFKPLSHDLPGPQHGSFPKQQFDSNLGIQTADTRIFGLNQMVQSGIYTNCMIAPLSKQPELMPVSLYPPTASDPTAQSACSQNWATVAQAQNTQAR